MTTDFKIEIFIKDTQKINCRNIEYIVDKLVSNY